MKVNSMRFLDSIKHLCPFLSKQIEITSELVSKNANKCPFMKHTNLVSDQETPSIENISEKLKNPLNFLDLEAFSAKPEDSLENHFQSAIQRLKDEGRYRVFTNILRNVGEFPKATEYMTGSSRKITV